MTGAQTTYTQQAPLRVWRSILVDPVRTLQIVLLVVVLGYGARQDNHSPFTVGFMENVIGSTFSGVEVVVFLIAFLEILRRLAAANPCLTWTAMSRPMLWVGLVLGVYPYMHMLLTENAFRFPVELTGFPMLVGSFLLYSQMFRRGEVSLMAWMLIIAGVYKSIEGIAIFSTFGLGWGLLSGWRDAALLSMMIIGALMAVIVRSREDVVYRNVRRAMLLAAPVALFTFTNSTRRSYILGVVVAMGVVAFYLLPAERRRLLWMIPLLVAAVLGAAFLTGKSQFLDRMSAFSNPSGEGSTAYRLIEVYNITREIQERPVLGWPYGRTWQNYTLLDFDNVSQVTPHNTYLYVAWRGGLTGLAIWIGFLIVLLRLHHRTIRAARTTFERFTATWLMGSTISIIAAGFTMPITTDHLQTFFPFLVAMTALQPSALPDRFEERRRRRTGMWIAGAPQTP